MTMELKFALNIIVILLISKNNIALLFVIDCGLLNAYSLWHGTFVSLVFTKNTCFANKDTLDVLAPLNNGDSTYHILCSFQWLKFLFFKQSSTFTPDRPGLWKRSEFERLNSVFSLFFSAKAPVINPRKMKNRDLDEGDKLELTCRLKGRPFPKPIFLWEKDGVDISIASPDANIRNSK